MGSHDEATPNRQKDETSSLAARRARLRGSLVKQAIPADPYNTSAANDESSNNSSPASQSASGQSDPDQNVESTAEPTSNFLDSSAMSTSKPSSDPAKSNSSKQFTMQTTEPPMPDDSEFEYDPTTYNSGMFGKTTSAFSSAFSSSKQEPALPFANVAVPAVSPLDYEYGTANQSIASPSFNGNTPLPVYGSVSGQTWTNPIGAIVDPVSPLSAEQMPAAQVDYVAQAIAPVVPSIEEESKPAENPKKGRGQKSKDKSRDSGVESGTSDEQPLQESDENEVTEHEKELARLAQDQLKREIEAEFQAPAVVPLHLRGTSSGSSIPNFDNVQLPDPLTFASSSTAQGQVLELLNNMDQAMGACAMNLSTLQKTAGEQTEALKALTRTLEHQTFSELGLNLSSMMESLAAALEPMKAVSDLVPAIDALVSELGGKVSREEPLSRLSPDQLLMNLADQLGAGIIDPWTFKSAYMAVFPADHPADLLHRLVDLLGTQRLSGELFRSAYDAVQGNDPPPAKRGAGTASSDVATVSAVQDEALLAQLEQLKAQQGSFEEKMQNREKEFSQMLGAKEQELHDAQELLHSRWDEFNTRYDELSDSLVKRDEILQEKETEIARKESENIQLRAQMEELRDMMTDLQKQFSSGKANQQNDAQNSFFDAGAQNAPSKQTQSLFDAEPAKPLFQGQSDVTETNIPISPARPPVAPPNQALSQGIAAPGNRAQQPQQLQAQPHQQAQLPQAPANAGSQQGVLTQPQINQQMSSQAVPRQGAVTTPFAGAGPGSYGSGVRAQVFEVIVRQALAGAPWREICAGPMQVNNISPDEVEVEVKRRQALLKK
jgi:hypothetical protein